MQSWVSVGEDSGLTQIGYPKRSRPTELTGLKCVDV